MVYNFLKKYSGIFFALFIFLVVPLSLAYAYDASSSNFQVSESIFGPGGELTSTSFSIPANLSGSQTGTWYLDTVPIPVGDVTSCGKLTSPGTYTLQSDISNITSTCFTIKADNVIINGNGHTVTAAAGNTNPAITSMPDLVADNRANAFTNVIIKNITFTGFEHGFVGKGADVPEGIGGHGASTTISNTVMGDVDVSGGDPIEQAGDGGSIFAESSVLGRIISNGGNSTACGISGNGGDIYLTTDTSYVAIINNGGVVLGCDSGATIQAGARGAVRTNLISPATLAAQASAARGANNGLVNRIVSRLPGNGELFNVVLPIKKFEPFSLKDLPVFSTDPSRGAFSFADGIQKFLFGAIPADILQKFSGSPKIFASLGITTLRDIHNLKSKPITVPRAKDVPGLYKVSLAKTATKPTTVIDSKVIYDEKSGIAQSVSIGVNTNLVVDAATVTGTIDHATFAGERVPQEQKKAYLVGPKVAGSYVFSSPNTPLRLFVNVVASNSDNTDTAKKENIFKRTIKKIFSIFK